MIISDRHRFVFVHVPKCAGTLVRTALAPYDEADPVFRAGRGTHPVLGAVDHAHLPLAVLAEHFPAEHAKAVAYPAYAVLRDPRTRFGSSVSERLRMYLGKPVAACSTTDISDAVDATIAELSAVRDQVLLPADLVHFQPQVGYVEEGGERVVEHLYRIDEVDRLLADLGQRVGADLAPPVDDPATTNRSEVYRSEAVRRVAGAVRPVLDPVVRRLPAGVVRGLKQRLYVSRDDRLGRVFDSASVQDFVSDYYAEDLALWRSLG